MPKLFKKPLTHAQRIQVVLITLLVVAASVALIFGLRHSQETQQLLRFFRNYRQYLLDIRHLGPYAGMAFVVVIVLFAVTPGAPTSVTAFVAGAVLGRWLGFTVDVIGLTIGNLIQSRLFQRINAHREEPTSHIYRWLVHFKYPVTGLVIGYAIPFIPTVFVNMAANATKMNLRTHFLACLLGSSVAAFIYAFSADLLVFFTAWKSLLVFVTLAAIIGLTEIGVQIGRNRSRQN
ncbi:VTT domain-containing protein [Lacticaseibacillus pabuli]|uniref:TVP38/TMEM64 family membrane protein n=1 Tax=Lacticaseibacillus pabuli TaxID=3025672 RepID=A0ABY7WW30_9LACO|nr:VTT domain-containing protein [Lacticaseibacillus sp. KACC 23028]WDF83196.1 VTT domain-containing protein [Lacticaseibacillus sp. KACC 23028]